MSHRNAPLTPEGLYRLAMRVHAGRPFAHVAAEAARLQGFPDSYKWVGSRVAIARQIGNAVPVAMGRAIANQLLEPARQPEAVLEHEAAAPF